MLLSRIWLQTIYIYTYSTTNITECKALVDSNELSTTEIMNNVSNEIKLMAQIMRQYHVLGFNQSLCW